MKSPKRKKLNPDVTEGDLLEIAQSLCALASLLENQRRVEMGPTTPEEVYAGIGYLLRQVACEIMDLIQQM